MRKCILAILFFLSFNICIAYTGSPKQQLIQLLKELKQGKSSTAVDDLFFDSPILKKEFPSITTLKQQLNKAHLLYGDYLHHEHLSDEELTPSIMRFKIALLHEWHPVCLQFIFYKAEKEWILIKVTFDETLNLIKKH